MTTKLVKKGALFFKDAGLFSSWCTCEAELYEDGTFKLSFEGNTVPSFSVNISKVNYQEQIQKSKNASLYVLHPKRTFYVSCEDVIVLREWRNSFVQVGAKEKKSSSSKLFASFMEEEREHKLDAHPLEVADMHFWSYLQVIEWLSYIRDRNLVRMNHHYALMFKENDINGKSLVKLNDADLQSIGIVDEINRTKILHEVQKVVKNNNRFSLNEHKIMAKFEQFGINTLRKVKNLESITEALGNVELLKKKNLNKNFDCNDESVKEYLEEDRDFDDTTHESQSGHKNWFLRDAGEKKGVRIKLIVSELLNSDRQKSMRKIISPVACCFPSLHPKFGIFHTSIAVGPFLLEWTDSNLCIPKQIAGSMALIALDIGTLQMVAKQSLDEIIDKLAHLIVEWNVNRQYCAVRFPNKYPNEGNCQDFMEAVLTTLGLPMPSFTGALGAFLNDMKNKGDCELSFKPDAHFLKTFDLSEPSYIFTSHKELDLFVTKLQETSSTFKLDFPNEYNLLKAFDRAFWIRYFKESSNEMYAPHECPHEDPRITKSIIV